jgi:hypothetical protein
VSYSLPLPPHHCRTLSSLSPSTLSFRPLLRGEAHTGTSPSLRLSLSHSVNAPTPSLPTHPPPVASLPLHAGGLPSQQTNGGGGGFPTGSWESGTTPSSGAGWGDPAVRGGPGGRRPHSLLPTMRSSRGPRRWPLSGLPTSLVHRSTRSRRLPSPAWVATNPDPVVRRGVSAWQWRSLDLFSSRALAAPSHPSPTPEPSSISLICLPVFVFHRWRSVVWWW